MGGEAVNETVTADPKSPMQPASESLTDGSTAEPVTARPTRAKKELTELLGVAMRILPEYADKLDRLAQSALTIWHQREKRPDSLSQQTSVIVGRDLDVLLNMALLRLGREFLGL